MGDLLIGQKNGRMRTGGLAAVGPQPAAARPSPPSRRRRQSHSGTSTEAAKEACLGIPRHSPAGWRPVKLIGSAANLPALSVLPAPCCLAGWCCRGRSALVHREPTPAHSHTSWVPLFGSVMAGESLLATACAALPPEESIHSTCGACAMRGKQVCVLGSCFCCWKNAAIGALWQNGQKRRGRVCMLCAKGSVACGGEGGTQPHAAPPKDRKGAAAAPTQGHSGSGISTSREGRAGCKAVQLGIISCGSRPAAL